MQTLIQDLRYAVRSLRKSPGFAGIAVLTLALGIGATTAVFSVVNGVLLRPLPFADVEGLVRVFDTNAEKGLPRFPASVPNYLDWRGQNDVFEEMAAVGNGGYALADASGGPPERVGGAAVTAGCFPLLRVSPMIGRNFTPDDERYGNHHVALLSHGLWMRRFGGDAGVVGRTVTIGSLPYTVIGVMPPGFHFPSRQSHLWTPYAFNQGQLDNRGQHTLDVIARLRPGVSVAQAQSAMDVIARRLEQQYPQSNRGWGVTVVSMREQLVGTMRRPLLVLMGAVSFVLVIACANVSNLLLARGWEKRGELAVRAALGAPWQRVARQLLTESMVLSLAGGAAGLLLAAWGIRLLLAMGPGDSLVAAQASIDMRVLAFALGLSVMTGLVFGVIPARQVRRYEVMSGLKQGGRSGGGAAAVALSRRMLVSAEVALSFVLLVGAGLMVRTLSALLEVDPGFRPNRVVVMDVALPAAKYKDTAARVPFVEQVLDGVRALPAVEAAGAALGIPLSPETDTLIAVRIAGDSTPWGANSESARYRQVTPGFFAALGTPVLYGRDFSNRDRADAPPVVIVSEQFARRFFPGMETPLGLRIEIGDDGPNPCEIVGIVQDVRHASLDTAAGPQVYRPLAQKCWGYVGTVVRSSAEPAALARAVAAEVAALDPGQPVHDVRTLADVVDQSLAQRRFSTLLLVAFAATAVILACAGIYGVVSYTVVRRTREIGIRVAVGARPRHVLRMVLRHGLFPAWPGLFVGLLLSLALTRVLQSQLFEISMFDPGTFATVAAGLALITLLACCLPASRALRLDPMAALRHE